jgi:tetraacyldisaccharide 4'-kinase
VSLGATVVAEAYFEDHHAFRASELETVRLAAKAVGAVIATTEKDAQRLTPGFPALVVRLEEELVEGAELLAQQLQLDASKVV